MTDESFKFTSPAKEAKSWTVKTVAKFYLGTVSGALVLFCLAVVGGGLFEYSKQGLVGELFGSLAVLYFILLVLVSIEAYGLFKQLSWARTYGMVFGVLLFLPLCAMWFSHPVPQIDVRSIVSILAIIYIFYVYIVSIVVYLMRSKQSVVWLDEKNSRAISVILCIVNLVIALFCAYYFYKIGKVF